MRGGHYNIEVFSCLVKVVRMYLWKAKCAYKVVGRVADYLGTG